MWCYIPISFFLVSFFSESEKKWKGYVNVYIIPRTSPQAAKKTRKLSLAIVIETKWYIRVDLSSVTAQLEDLADMEFIRIVRK